MRSFAPALLLVALASPLVAQERLTESIEVRVVNIDVVVTDRSGNRVTGLTRDDFEILENQKPQRITNFHEIRGGKTVTAAGGETADPPPAPPRRFVFFFDIHSLHPANRKQLASSVRKFIDTHVGPNDLASIVTWNRALEVVAPLTRDRKALAAATNSVASDKGASGIKTHFARAQKHCLRGVELVRNGSMKPNVAYLDCINVAREMSIVTTTLSRQLLSAIELTTTTIAGAEGKKVLILAGALLPKDPGIEIYQWANMLFAPYLLGSFDGATARPDQQDAQHEFLKKVVETANAHEVALYTIAATTTGETSTADYERAVDDLGHDFMNQTNTFASYELLSSMTGGVSVKRPSDFDVALGAVGRDLDSYYSLGFRPTDTSSRGGDLTVRTGNRNHVVRARQTHTFKTADDLMSDRVVANLYMPDGESSWRSSVHTGPPQRSGDKFAVPLEVVIPNQLTLLPSGPTLAGGFTVYIAVGSPQGALSSVFRQPEIVRVKPADENAFRQEPLLFGATLTVRPGENILSVGVVDHVSGSTSFTRTKIVAQ